MAWSYSHRAPWTHSRAPGSAHCVYKEFRESRITEQVYRETLERETGIEPATNGLGSRYSTIELLPLGN